MLNKNHRKGAEDIGKLAAVGFEMIGKEVIGAVDELKKALEYQNIFENEALNLFDDIVIRQTIQEYGFAPEDFSLIDEMSPENKIVFISALYLLVEADETKSTNEYFGLAVVRFGVRQLIDGDKNRIHHLVGKLSPPEATLLMRMICEMTAISNNNSALLSVSEAIAENLLIADKHKQQIRSEVEKLAKTCGLSIFVLLLAEGCAKETKDESANNDGYEICDRFNNFSGGQKKFIDADIVLTDRYLISNTSVIFENCTFVFESTLARIVEVKGGDLSFINCKFISKQKPDDEVFAVKETTINLSDCIFDKWSAGLFLSMENGSLSVANCSFLSCKCSLIFATHPIDASFNNCHFENQNNGIAFIDSPKNDLEINDCTFKDCYFSCESLIATRSKAIVNRGTFVNSGMNTIAGYNIKYHHCVFENCHDDMVNSWTTRDVEFSFCDITDYKGNIGTAFAPFYHMTIKSCKLIGFKGSFYAQCFDIDNTSFERCSGDSSGYGINTDNYLYVNEAFGFNPLNSMVSTGSLFEIKPKKEDSASEITKCRFVECRSKGALVVAFTNDKSKNVVNIHDCEIVNCSCTEGYFVGVYSKKNKFYIAPKAINEFNNNIDIFDEKHRKQLIAFLKDILTDGLVKSFTKFHKTPIEYKITKNICESVMNGVYDDILAMYDDSVWSNGRSGFVFGSKAIYISQMMESSYLIPYEKIAHIDGFSIEHKKFGDNYSATLIIELDNGRSISFRDPNIEKIELKKLLVGIKKLLNSEL